MMYENLNINQKINVKSHILVAETFVSKYYNRYTEVAKLDISDLEDTSCKPSDYAPYKSLETIKTRILDKCGKIYHYGVYRSIPKLRRLSRI